MLPLNQPPTSADISRLSREVRARFPITGAALRINRAPWGSTFIPRRQIAETTSSPIFRPSVATTAAGYEITWERGLIDGVEPTIDGQPISGDPGTGDNQPPLIIAAADFGAAKEASVYFRSHLTPGWFVDLSTPLFSILTPTPIPWHTDRLALILHADGEVLFRSLHMNQGHLAINRLPSGFAQHIYRGQL